MPLRLGLILFGVAHNELGLSLETHHFDRGDFCSFVLKIWLFSV
jgi:hypothetical protein